VPPPPSRAWPLRRVQVQPSPNCHIPVRWDLSVRRPSLYPTASSITQPRRRRRRHFTKSPPPIGTHATPDPPPPRMERRLCSAVLLRALPLMLRRPPSRSQKRNTIWPPHRLALTNLSTRSDHMIGRLLYVFFPLSPLRARQLPSSSFITQLHACGTIFPFGIFGTTADLRVSILSCLTRSPPKAVHPPILSLSFVALVKSSVGTLLLPRSLLFFPCLAAVPACVLCFCFACVSMSNDSIPHWPMHDSPFVGCG
jgi:hypothetical protein